MNETQQETPKIIQSEQDLKDWAEAFDVELQIIKKELSLEGRITEIKNWLYHNNISNLPFFMSEHEEADEYYLIEKI